MTSLDQSVHQRNQVTTKYVHSLLPYAARGALLSPGER